jgi:hypothetical protein
MHGDEQLSAMEEVGLKRALTLWHFTLSLFALINVALIRIKSREPEAPRGVYVTQAWVPWAGLISCVAFLIADLAVRIAS